MAIVLEEEKKKTNWMGIISAIIFIAIIFFGGYYLFFTKPELLADIGAPQRLQDLSQLTKLSKFDPKTVIDSPNFKMLRDYSSALTLPQAGRDNPFQPL
ncbi:MAG: hypothetical protein WCW78_02890 [Candidatus Paceibacterota bacterium]|jgi:hypothetical protein